MTPPCSSERLTGTGAAESPLPEEVRDGAEDAWSPGTPARPNADQGCGLLSCKAGDTMGEVAGTGVPAEVCHWRVTWGATRPRLCLCGPSPTSMTQPVPPKLGVVLRLPSPFVFLLVGSVVVQLRG